VIAAYSIATFPDGTVSREIMNIDQIEDIRKLSRSKKGPWSNPIFYPEMCRKTVARLHSKQLPMSTDLDTLMRRDDDLYDFKGERERSKEITDRRPRSVAAALDYFAGEPGRNGSPEPEALPPPDDDVPPVGEPPVPPPGSAGPPPSGPPQQSAEPKTQAEYMTYARRMIENALDHDKLQTWFASKAQRDLRAACMVMREVYEDLAFEMSTKVTSLRNQTVR
jgi:recombination protein RecT